MALTGWTSSNYLYRNAAVRDTCPFVFSAWGYLVAATTVATQVAVHQGQAGTFNHVRGGLYRFTNTSIKLHWRGTSNQGCETSTSPSNNTWFHMYGGFWNTSGAIPSRSVYLDAAGKGTVSNTSAPNASTLFRIGADSQTTPDKWETAGAIAEVSVWDGTNFDTEFKRGTFADKLVTKVSGYAPNPLAVNAEVSQDWTGQLVAYWRLTDTSDIADLSGNGHNLSLQGSLSTFGSHAPVDPVPGGAAAFPNHYYQMMNA